jgi:hypothetical protein
MISINETIAAEHRADLHRDAAKRRLSRSGAFLAAETAQTARIAIQPAGDADGHLVRQLAQLDDAPELEGPALLALVDGKAVAALSLLDRRVVADPFVLTQDTVALLRLRANHVLGKTKHRFRPIFRPRFA